MKWSERTAQGFSLASALGQGANMCALQVAPEETSFGIGTVDPQATPKHRAPLSGHVSVSTNPGLKPSAILSDHFMVRNLAP